MSLPCPSRRAPRKGKIARWFDVGGMPCARYLCELHESGAVVWDARVEDALVFSWTDAQTLARRLRAVPLTADDSDELVCAVPPERAAAALEERCLF